jgi:PTH1 family peptidyl-tRNA hydrolase
MIKLVVFLGNPGSEYARTRHNIAWMLAERLSFYSRLSWRRKFKGWFAQERVGGISYTFLKPETFMNKSGESVRPLLDFFRILPAELLAVHDDLELSYGRVGFKQGGGLGGHNGLRSMKHILGTSDFGRFRLGIGRPARGSVSSYVLGAFSDAERAVLPRYLELAARLLEERLEGCAVNPGADPVISLLD